MNALDDMEYRKKHESAYRYFQDQKKMMKKESTKAYKASLETQ